MSAPSSSKTLLLLGATGATGSQALLSALASPSISSVLSFGRRSPSLPETTPGFSKLQHVELDFDKLLDDKDVAEQRKLKEAKADLVVVALGTTRAQSGGMDKFVRIDREFVLEAAKHARVEGKEQVLVYCSSGGSSSSSFIPYSKSKGLTEEGLASLGYDETIIFRPGMLVVPGGRPDHRLMESIAAKVTGVLSLISSSIEIKTPILGNAMVFAALERSAALSKAQLGHEEVLQGHKAWVLGNAEAHKLGDRQQKL